MHRVGPIEAGAWPRRAGAPPGRDPGEFEQLLVDDTHSEFPVFGHLLALDAAAAGSTAPPTAPWTARDDACLARFLDANQVNVLLSSTSITDYL